MFEEPTRLVSDEEATKMNLRYYDSQIHKAAFILPRFARKVRNMSMTIHSYSSYVCVLLGVGKQRLNYGTLYSFMSGVI